jgi:hypothetical protein
MNDTRVADIKGFVALDQKRIFCGSCFRRLRKHYPQMARRLHIHSSAIHPPGCASCWVHSGFDLTWSERRTAVLDAVTSALATHPYYSLIITGHSIVAGLATLAGAELRNMNYSADIHTFGSPRVGNEPFANSTLLNRPNWGETTE